MRHGSAIFDFPLKTLGLNRFVSSYSSLVQVTFVGCHGQRGGKGKGQGWYINGMAIFDSFGPTHCPLAQMLKMIPLVQHCQHFIWIKSRTKMTIIQLIMTACIYDNCMAN
jgi:hypothetical protein